MAQAFAIPAASGKVGPNATDTTSPVSLYGWSLREDGTGVAVVNIREGGVVGGTIVGTLSFAISGMDTKWLGDKAVNARGGLYVEYVSGAGHVVGSIWVG